MATTTTPTTVTSQVTPSVPAVPTPSVVISPAAVPHVKAVSASATVVSKSVTEPYTIEVRAPEAGGMLAYLVGPGAVLNMQSINFDQISLMNTEAGNLRIKLANGAEILLLDYVAAAKAGHSTVITSDGTLPAQTLLGSLTETLAQAKQLADIEPASGPIAAQGEVGGGLLPPPVLGTGMGSGIGIYSSVIDPFGLGLARDEIQTPLLESGPLAPLNSVDAVDDVVNLARPIAAQSTTIAVTTNDVDPQSDTFTVTRIVSGPAIGTAVLNPDGTITYTAAAGTRTAYTTTLVYEIEDALGAKDTATVTINVAAAPLLGIVGNNDVFNTAFQTPIAFTRADLLANDSDPDGGSLTVVGITAQPANGTIQDHGGHFTFTPNPGFSGSTSTSYHLVDSQGQGVYVTITFNVGEPPVVEDNSPPPSDNNGGGNGDAGGDCPLVIDFTGQGVSMINAQTSGVQFDTNGDGTQESVAWFTGANIGVVARDLNNNGSIDGVPEVYGGRNLDGFTDLQQREDSNGDGVITAADANWADLRVWFDANHDGFTQAGELRTLDSLGITQIGTATTPNSVRYEDSFIQQTATVTLANGQTLNSYDVWFEAQHDGVVKGTNGNDTLVASSTADAYNGGTGTDTLLAQTANTLTLTADNTRGVEAINLTNNGADQLTLNLNDVLTMSDTHSILITGDAVDAITLLGDATRGDDVTQDGHTYASFTGSNGGAVLVELGLHVNGEHLQ